MCASHFLIQLYACDCFTSAAVHHVTVVESINTGSDKSIFAWFPLSPLFLWIGQLFSFWPSIVPPHMAWIKRDTWGRNSPSLNTHLFCIQQIMMIRVKYSPYIHHLSATGRCLLCGDKVTPTSMSKFTCLLKFLYSRQVTESRKSNLNVLSLSVICRRCWIQKWLLKLSHFGVRVSASREQALCFRPT